MSSLDIKPTGSVLDLIMKLREHSIRQSEYDAAYEKVFGTSGKPIAVNLTGLYSMTIELQVI